MKRLSFIVMSVLIVFSLTTYAGEINKPKVPSTASTETIAGSYKVSESYPLTKAIHGVDGVLQLSITSLTASSSPLSTSIERQEKDNR
jgi:hypothetical protein